MHDKILGVVCLTLSLFSQVWISHPGNAEVFSWIFGILGVLQLLIGEIRMRQGK